MPMASSWKLSTTLRWKKSLGNMPSPVFARAALEPVDRLAVALAVGVVHRGKQVGRPRQLELHDGQPEAGMTLEDAGEDQIAHRQRRIEHLGRGCSRRAASCRRPRGSGPSVASPCRLTDRSSAAATGPERLLFGLVVAPVLERIFGDHRTGVFRSYDGLASSR
jgi:hypothetical protein